MRKRVVTIMLVVGLVAAVSLSVGCAGAIGSGNLETEERYFTDFTRVEVSSAFEVEIIQSDSFGVSITADDNLLKYVHVSKSGETLKIDVGRGGYNFNTLEARITMIDLYGVDLSGATEGTVRGFSSSHDFSVELSGASSLNMRDVSAGDVKFGISGASSVTGDLTAADVRFDVSGASSIRLDGSANDIVIDGSGASRMRLDDFSANNADVSLSGASSGTVNLDGKLDIELSGASSFHYIGEPTIGDIDISGASSMSEK
ncbi:head GIN domain-containing protein [Chloroflexota bacterium]